jgi:hypothetical protein
MGHEGAKGMSSRRTPVSGIEAQELEAQRIACSYLVKGCERALFQFGLIAGETSSVEAARVDVRAVDIMRQVLSSWRETLAELPSRRTARSRNAAGWAVMDSIDRRESALNRRAN